MTIYHIHISIPGALSMSAVNFANSYQGVFFHNDGTLMNLIDAREELEIELSMGHAIVPGVGCDNFDWITGCRGHEEGDTQ